MLRNGSKIYRIIEPPDATIKSDLFPSGSLYQGGPILVMQSSSGIVTSVRPAFPSLVLHKVKESYTSDRIFIVEKPTKVLWMDGGWGHTNDLLNEMKIPYDRCDLGDMWNHPNETLKNHSLLMDDCNGLSAQTVNGTMFMPPQTIWALRNFVSSGNEIIAQCLAAEDLKLCFPGFLTGTLSKWPSSSSTVTELPDFPAQYHGNTNVNFKLVWAGINALSPKVNVMADGGSWVDAAFFYYGKGIAEYLSFHAGDQTGDARRAAITLYGNKFIHSIVPPDLEILTDNSVSPGKIWLSGSGQPSPPPEEATVTLTVQPVGGEILPNNTLILNEKLQTYIVQAGKFTIPPSSISPDGRTFSWKINNIPTGGTWTVQYNIKSNMKGNGVPINIPNRTLANYTNNKGSPVTNIFNTLSVDVIAPSAPIPPPVPPPPPPLPPTPPPPNVPVLTPIEMPISIPLEVPMMNPLMNPVTQVMVQPQLMLNTMLQPMMNPVNMPNFVGMVTALGMMEKIKIKRKMRALKVGVRREAHVSRNLCIGG
jgi:hypothetical protein